MYYDLLTDYSSPSPVPYIPTHAFDIIFSSPSHVPFWEIISSSFSSVLLLEILFFGTVVLAWMEMCVQVSLLAATIYRRGRKYPPFSLSIYVLRT